MILPIFKELWVIGDPDSKECTMKLVPVHMVLFLQRKESG